MRSNSGDLFTYLEDHAEDRLSRSTNGSMARREYAPLRYWESALMLATAFGLTPPPLTPIQLPFSAGEPWLALEYPDDLPHRQRPPALHLPLFAALQSRGRANAAFWSTSGRR